MVWVIIGCTILIIVCLGGGKLLAQIVGGVTVLVGLMVFLAQTTPPNDTGGHSPVSILSVVGICTLFFVMMAVSMRRRD